LVPVAALASAATVAVADGHTQHYLVRPGSSYHDACFQPCRCNLDWRDDLSGAFTLTRLVSDLRVRTFEVSGAQLVAPSLARIYTGAGLYQVAGEPPTADQRLRLDLSSDAFSAAFDSGAAAFVSAADPWPVVRVSIGFNNFECHDTVFSIVASRTSDWDASGERSVGDLFEFLADYFTGQGDANGDGFTTIDDLFAFLSDFFEPV
jgi:hypothetical protein